MRGEWAEHSQSSDWDEKGAQPDWSGAHGRWSQVGRMAWTMGVLHIWQTCFTSDSQRCLYMRINGGTFKATLWVNCVRVSEMAWTSGFLKECH